MKKYMLLSIFMLLIISCNNKKDFFHKLTVYHNEVKEDCVSFTNIEKREVCKYSISNESFCYSKGIGGNFGVSCQIHEEMTLLYMHASQELKSYEYKDFR